MGGLILHLYINIIKMKKTIRKSINILKWIFGILLVLSIALVGYALWNLLTKKYDDLTLLIIGIIGIVLAVLILGGSKLKYSINNIKKRF